MIRLQHFYWFPVAIYAVLMGACGQILWPQSFRTWEALVLLAGFPLGMWAIWQATREREMEE